MYIHKNKNKIVKTTKNFIFWKYKYYNYDAESVTRATIIYSIVYCNYNYKTIQNIYLLLYLFI